MRDGGSIAMTALRERPPMPRIAMKRVFGGVLGKVTESAIERREAAREKPLAPLTRCAGL
jgi:hypothetical protein